MIEPHLKHMIKNIIFTIQITAYATNSSAVYRKMHHKIKVVNQISYDNSLFCLQHY